MKAVAIAALRWAKDYVIEWLEGPEGRQVLVQVLRDLADKTETELDDRALEVVIQGLENIEKF